MNDFLKEKENLLNSIENNTSEHWKEYYKDVPLNCIFDDLVIDINEIKRLTAENQQLKEQLESSEKARKEAIDYINFLVIIDTQLAGGRFKDTIWGKELLEILDIDKGE